MNAIVQGSDFEKEGEIMKITKVQSAAVLLALAISATGCSGKSGAEVSSSEKAQAAIEAAVDAAKESEAEALKEENLGSNEGADLSPYEKLYTFTLAGKEYSLSCPVQELLDDGWVFSEKDVTMDGTEAVTLNEAVEKGTKFDVIETPDFSMFKTIDGTSYEVMMGIYSDSTKPKTLGEFRLGYIYVRQDLGLDMILDTGITFGDSEKAVREVYGEPISEAEGVLSYSFTDESVALMPNRPDFLNFYVNKGTVYMISLQYFPVLS